MKLLYLIILLVSAQLWSQTNFEKAELLFQQKQFGEAKALFEKEYKAKPNDARIVEYLGDIAGYQKHWDEAISYYRKLKNQAPEKANYWYKFGGAMGMKAKSVSKLKALGMLDDIEKSFLKAAQLDKKHIDTRWALVMFYIELPGIVGGSEKKALLYSNELLALSKVDGYLSKGYIDEYFGRYKKAETSYIKAHEIGNSKTTFQKLYNLYTNKLKDKTKAAQLKEHFDNDTK